MPPARNLGEQRESLGNMDFVLGRAKAFRDALRRADPAYLQSMSSAQAARFLVTNENKIALLTVPSAQNSEAEVSSGVEINSKGAALRQLLLLSHSQVPLEIAAQANYLGIYSQTPYFGIELGRLVAVENNAAATLSASSPTLAAPASPATPPLAANILPLVLPPNSEFLPLYTVGPELSDLEVGLATAQIALGNWQLSQKYCSICAAPTSFQNGGWEAHCARGHIIFPRTDPAIIVGVLDAQDRLLLGRKAGWDKRRFSALAGFIEAGETAEMAVVREVQEEAGIAVEDVQYLSTQPWPFPRSLMLVYTARTCDSTPEIKVDGEEIVEAHFFTRQELQQKIADGEITLPSRSGAVHVILRAWYAGQEEA